MQPIICATSAVVRLTLFGGMMQDTPQLENGYTPIANEIMEALMKVNLSAYESRVLWFLFRKTYGWSKKTDWITLSQFSECIGLDRRLVHRAIKGLSSKKMIIIYKDDTFKIKYGFQKDYKKWNLSSKKMTVINRDDGVSSKEMTRLSSKEIPTKESITKETIQKKKEEIVLPDWLDKSLWEDYKEHRKNTKAKLTLKAEELAIKKLDKFRASGNDIRAVIEQSIENGWKGLFEVKREGQNATGRNAFQQRQTKEQRDTEAEAERINAEYRAAKAREAAGQTR